MRRTAWWRGIVCSLLGHDWQTYWGWETARWCDRCGLTRTPEVLAHMEERR